MTASCIELSKIEAYRIKRFEEKGITAAFSKRNWHILGTTPPEPSRHDLRLEFCKSLGIDSQKLVCLKQVHGTNITRLADAYLKELQQTTPPVIDNCDAVLTDLIDVPIGMFSADCAPLFLADPDTRSCALVHIGWKGALQGLAAKSVQAFRGQFKSKASDILAAIGPLICADCYEVGNEFVSYFGEFVHAKGDKYHFDLKAYIISELLKQGLTPENIVDSGFCTSCQNDQFYSYRREKNTEFRIFSVMMIH